MSNVFCVFYRFLQGPSWREMELISAPNWTVFEPRECMFKRFRCVFTRFKHFRSLGSLGSDQNVHVLAPGLPKASQSLRPSAWPWLWGRLGSENSPDGAKSDHFGALFRRAAWGRKITQMEPNRLILDKCLLSRRLGQENEADGAKSDHLEAISALGPPGAVK